MSRKKLWLITILVLSISFLSSVAFASPNQNENFEIWPVDIDPPDGSVDIIVPTDENVIIRTSFRSCSRLLSRAWTIADIVNLEVDGDPVVSTRKESWLHWSKPIPVSNEDEVPCVNGSDTLWVVDWKYDLGMLAEGNYQVHFAENVKYPFTDGADYDGDGRRDFFEWHVNVDFNIITNQIGGSISGTVVEEDIGLGIEGLEVSACEFENDDPCWSAWTEADGSYTISGVPAGIYRLSTGWEEGWVVEAYLEQSDYFSGDPVTVGPGENLIGYDFTLERGGSISGHVSDANGDVVGVHVDICAWDDSFCMGNETDENGDYLVYGLPEGDYRVSIWGGYGYWVDQYYDHVRDWDDATPVTVIAGSNVDDINFDLESGGRISGHVSDANGDVVGVHVDVCAWDDSYCMGSETDENGDYLVYGLPEGDYRVSIWGGQGGWLDEFFEETPFYDEATPVAVVAGSDTSDINFTMDAGGTISGTVYEANSGDPLATIAGVHVDACSTDDTFCNGTDTNELGEYTITGLLPEKTYRVFIWGQPGWSNEVYQETIWWDQATLVSVGEIGIDFTLEPAGSISGFVTDSDGNLLANIGVDIMDGGYGACTDENGYYAIMGLPFGTYDIVAGRDFCGPHPFVEQVTSGVTIDADNPDLTGYDFQLMSGGSISGMVTAVGGGLIGDNIDVSACFADDSFCGWASVQSDGTYEITGLPAGNYRVHAYQWPEGYWIGEVYDNTQDWDAYIPVSVTAGAETFDIDFTLELGGAITGTVKDGDENGIEGIWIVANDYAGDFFVSWSQTDSTGAYRILGLPAGDYRVFINPQNGWTGGEYSPSPVTVTAGFDTFDIDFALVQDSTISGTVTDINGDHIPERIDVAACLVENTDICWWTTVGEYNTYTIVGLLTGEYVINIYEVEDPGGNWIGQTYPSNIILGENEDVTGIDFTLEAAGE